MSNLGKAHQSTGLPFQGSMTDADATAETVPTRTWDQLLSLSLCLFALLCFGDGPFPSLRRPYLSPSLSSPGHGKRLKLPGRKACKGEFGRKAVKPVPESPGLYTRIFWTYYIFGFANTRRKVKTHVDPSKLQ